MADTDTVIDIETLAAPIGGDSPCGTDLRQDASFDSPYQRLRDAREEAMAVERVDKSAQVEGGDRGFYSDIRKWQEVVDQATAILTASSKDLEVCALLVEALSRTEGAAGIRDGFALTRQLVSTYWDELFPRLDPDDPDSMEDRVAGFTGLNGTSSQGPLARFILQIPVTEEGALGEFRCHQYQRALEISRNNDSEVREEQFEALGLTLEEVEEAAAESSIAFFVRRDREFSQCMEELRALDQAFMDACKHEAPPSSMLAESLETVADTIRFLGRDKIAAHEAAQAGEDAAEPEAAATESQGAAGAGKPQGASGPISSREDAVKRMRVIAKYFRDNEPHSPVSYALENVIRWSTMPLDRLLEEWIDDEGARDRYKLMTGMVKRSSDDEDS